jgi:hypothetical protein
MPAKPKIEKLTKAQKQALHTLLTTKYGFSLAKARQLINEDDAALSRLTIESALTAHFRGLTKS